MNTRGAVLLLVVILSLSTLGLLTSRINTATAESRSAGPLLQRVSAAVNDPPALALTPQTNPNSPQGTIVVEVRVSGVVNLGAFDLIMTYDPTYVQVTGMTVDPFLGLTASCNPYAERCTLPLGPAVQGDRSRAAAATYGTGPGASGDGVIAFLNFQPSGVLGTTVLHIEDAILGDVHANPIAPITQDATLDIQVIAFDVYLPILRRD